MTTWEEIIENETKQPYFKELMQTIDKRYEETTVFPPKNLIFNAFTQTAFENIKVVIFGQDPYHGKKSSTRIGFFNTK